MTDDISKVVRRFRGVGELEREGYIPAGSATERDRLESATTPAEVDAPEDGAYLIQYDDPDQSPELFVGHGAHDAARYRYERVSDNWNAHLFVKIASSSRDCTVPNYAATLARQLAEAKAANEIAASVHEHERMNFQVQLAAATRRVAEMGKLLLLIRDDYEAGLGITRENYDRFCRMGAVGRPPNDTWPQHFQRRKEQIAAVLQRDPN